MIAFLDTSAFIKRYVDEPDGARVRALFRRPDRVSLSRVTLAEASCTFARLQREGALTAELRDRLIGRLPQDLSQLKVIEARRAVIERVMDLAKRHPLRGYDAVQLASALALRGTGLGVELWTTAGRRARAAAAEGLKAVHLS